MTVSSLRRTTAALVAATALWLPSCVWSQRNEEPIRDPATAESEPGTRPSKIPVEKHEPERPELMSDEEIEEEVLKER